MVGAMTDTVENAALTPVCPVVLCGGSGTRLWPTSRKAYPKQFAPLLGTQSLYQRTLSRFSGAGFAAPLVMTGLIGFSKKGL